MNNDKVRKKISVIGAGNVGRATAAWIAMKELGDIVLYNRSKERAIGNALDLMEAGPIAEYDVKIKGTHRLQDTKDSDIIVFTAGLPRKPGMKREDLVKQNSDIIRPITKKLARLSPKAIFIMVTNPLDAMTYVALKGTRFPKHRVIGMAGILDTSRFKSFIAEELNVSREEISALVLGSHGENMVPVAQHATVGGIPLTSLMKQSKIKELVQHTKDAGAEIVGLLHANASFSVGCAAATLVESIVLDKKMILPCSAWLEGEYGIKDTYLGVPCKIGKKGIEDIIQIKLGFKEKRDLKAAAKRIKKMIKEI